MNKGELKQAVLQILMINVKARSDDFVLIGEVVKKCLRDESYITLDEIVGYHAQLGIPSFESITRVRRSIQKEIEYLKDEQMVKIRKAEEKKFKEEYRRNK